MNASWAQVANRFGGEVAVLSPPYRRVFPLPPLTAAAAPPPGTIVVGQGTHVIAVLAQLTAVVQQWPWVIPCLVAGRDEEPIEPLLMLISELHGRLAVVKRPHNQPHYDPTRILAAVRHRPTPTCDDLARWVSQRLRKSDLEAPLRSQFREAMERVPASREASISTYSRLFARHGRFTARDWRAIARLCIYAAAGPSSDSCSSPTSHIPLRRASHYVRKYLRQPQSVLAERVGWEWILEGGLRAWGYV